MLARKYKFKTVYKNLMTKKLVDKHRNSLKKRTHYTVRHNFNTSTLFFFVTQFDQNNAG
jgi:uncharacterized Rmd1/YagE family protein